MKIDVLTLFPDMFGPMTLSLMGSAQEKASLNFKRMISVSLR